METYRGRRAPRTARILTTARVWGEILHVDGAARTLRNELLTHRDTGGYTIHRLAVWTGSAGREWLTAHRSERLTPV